VDVIWAWNNCALFYLL